MQNYTDKKDIIGMILFALGALMLVYMLISPLNQLIVNVEEYFTLTLMNFPMADIFTMSGSDVNPPLYYLLAKGIAKMLGILHLESASLFALKVFSAIPYAIILIVSAVKVKEDYGWLTAGLFAFSLAVMSEFFAYYMLLRPSSWALLFVFLSFVFLKDIIDTNDMKYWILFTVFSVLGAYTYYFAAITSIALYILLLAYVLKFNRDLIKNWGISLAAFIICYIPWILPLANFLGSIKGGFWIPAPTADVIIQSLAYFAYSADTVFSIVTIVVLIVIGAVYYMNSTDKDNQIIIIGGIGAFLLTLIIGLVISIAYTPVLIARCMLPASALLWLAISIMISKIEGDKTFLISFALIILLLVSGIGGMIANNDALYKSGSSQKEALDNILADDNATVILTTPNMIVHFLDYADRCDMYCIDEDYIYGENMDRVHQFFDFKDISKDGIGDLATNNTSKNIYLISWGEPDVGLNTTKLSSENGVVISQANIPEVEEEESY